MYLLTIYFGGEAILTDMAGETVWESAKDEDFVVEFGELITADDDGDDIVDYLEDAGVIPEDSEVEISESHDAGRGAAGEYDDDDDDDEDDLDEDDEDDEGGLFE